MARGIRFLRSRGDHGRLRGAAFHAEYSGIEALILIDSLEIYRGELPRRALDLMLEWAALHRAELRDAWQMAQGGRTPQPIPPLE